MLFIRIFVSGLTLDKNVLFKSSVTVRPITFEILLKTPYSGADVSLVQIYQLIQIVYNTHSLIKSQHTVLSY